MAQWNRGAWSEPVTVNPHPGEPCWHPVLFRDERFGVFLFFKRGPSPRQWRTLWMQTDDGGLWSTPTPLVPGDCAGRGPSKNPPIVLSSGAWLAPGSTELGGWGCFADRSEDGGSTWHRTDYFRVDHLQIRGRGVAQPAFWESRPGWVHAVMRTTAGYVGRSESIDGGRTWSNVQLTDIPYPNSPLAALQLPNGQVVLAFNRDDEADASAMPMLLAKTGDNGASWQEIAVLDPTLGVTYSYPALTQIGDRVALSCTVDHARIRCWQIPGSLL